jgi:dTDP-4-dehydrorhamnose reductase
VKILLLGSRGQLGCELQRSLAAVGQVLAYHHRRASEDSAANTIDLADAQALRALVQRTAPGLIVNAAAYTAVDAAEQHPQAAWAINAVAPGVLADAAQAQGAALLHFSTDYVFGGAGHLPQPEDAATAPLSVYGRSKLEGEFQVRSRASRHLILRTSWLYSVNRPNFLRSVLQRASEREVLSVVADQFGAPTHAAWLADITAQIAPQWWAEPHCSGTYHASAAGAVSRLAWAQAVIASAARAGWPLRANVATLRGISSAEHLALHPGTAVRPLNSRLDCTQLQRTFGITTPHWQDGVDQVLSQLFQDPTPP